MELKIFIDDRDKLNKKIESEIKKQLGEDLDEEAQREREIQRLIGNEDEDSEGFVKTIALNPDKLADETASIATLDIAIQSIYAVYRDEVNKIQGNDVMVVLTTKGEFDAIYEEDKYLSIKEYIKVSDSITIGSMSLNHEAIMNELRRAQVQQAQQELQQEQHKIVPMSNMDTNKN